MDKRAIVVAVTGEYADVAALTLPKIRAYAKRCNATLHVLDGLPDRFQHPKFRMFELAEIDADRILLLDADIIVRDSAPDLFEVFPDGNHMLDEQSVRRSGAFDIHKTELRRRFGCDHAFPSWWNPGVSLLDRDAARAVFQMPDYDVAAPENLWPVANGKCIVKNMPWVNYRIVAEGVQVSPLPAEWNCFVNPVNDLEHAHFWHCAGCESATNREPQKARIIRDVCRRYREPLRVDETPRYHVRFVPSSTKPWIIERMQQEIAKRAPGHAICSVGKRLDQPGVINYYLYRQWSSRSRDALDVVFCTHPELPELFVNAAREADHAVVMCSQYRDLLLDAGIQNVTLIYPGVDECYRDRRLRVFNPSRMGYCNGRKGDGLWKQLERLDWLDCVCSRGDMTPEQVLIEYQRADVIVSTATMEGGPMAALEALAVGKPMLARAGVGFVDDIEGVERYQGNNHLLDKLQAYWREKSAFQSQAAAYTWEAWASAHWALFDRLAREHALAFDAPTSAMPDAMPTVQVYGGVPRPVLRDAVNYLLAKGYRAVPVPYEGDGVISLRDVAQDGVFKRNRETRRQLEAVTR